MSIQPIESGPRTASRNLGFLVLGYEVDDALVRELSQVAASQVAFRYGDKVIRSTLSPVQEAELNPQRVEIQGSARPAPEEIQLGQERFLQTTWISLLPGPVRLFSWSF